MEHKALLALNLQYFAEGGNPSSTQAPSTTGAENPTSQGDPPPSDLNQMLATNKGLQSQFDQLVGKALTTARGNWEREQSMTAEQLAHQRSIEQVQALNQREQALLTRELRAEAMSTLAERSLPTELIDCIQTSDEAVMNRSLLQAEKAFRQAVQQGIEARMAGSAPKGASGNDSSHLSGFRAAAGVRGQQK